MEDLNSLLRILVREYFYQTPFLPAIIPGSNSKSCLSTFPRKMPLEDGSCMTDDHLPESRGHVQVIQPAAHFRNALPFLALACQSFIDQLRPINEVQPIFW